MAGKKKKSVSARKKRSNKAKTSPPDIHTVLAQADDAMNTSDVQTALGLYTYASDQIRARVEGSSSASEDNEAVQKRRTDVLLLSKTLGKCGEARVSLGDQEGGREAFLDAISLLGDGSGEGMEEDEEPGGGTAAVAAGGSVADAQLCEAKAGLHLYLGQLSEAEEALGHYKSGVVELGRCVSILEALVATEGGESAGEAVDSDNMEEHDEPGTLRIALVETKRQLCGAHCSVAELYLTDLCYDPDAEAQCETSLQAALVLDDSDGPPDAFQGMANLRLSQGRSTEAIRYILDAYSKMQVGCEAMADLVGLRRDGGDGTKDNSEDVEEKAKELVEVDAANSLPGFEFRCQTAKILLECAAVLKGAAGKANNDSETLKEREQGSFCVEASVQVLGSLLAENDEVVEVWYLLGCAFAASSPPNNDAARYYWETALEMLLKVKESLDQEVAATPDTLKGDADLAGQLIDIAEKIEEVQEKISGLVGSEEEEGTAAEVGMEVI